MSSSNPSRARAGAQVLNSPRATAVSAGPEPFQREHEMCDALLRLLIAHSRYGANNDADLALELMPHIKDAAKAFRRALSRKGLPQ